MDSASSISDCDTASWPADRRLVVTGHFVRAGRVGGAEPMLYNLLHGFAEANVATTLVCGDPANLSPTLARHILRRSVTIRAGGGLGVRFVAEQRACLDPALHADAVLFTNYFIPPIVPRRLGRVGVVMHDFQYRHFPEHFAAKKRAWLRISQAWAMQRADHVIAISDYVRDDAVRLFGDRFASKIAVVPNAVSWDRFAGGMDRARPLDRPYILAVAAHYPHKNLQTVIRAFAIVARQDADVQLVLCGQSYDGLHGVVAGRSGIGPLIDELGLTARVQLTGFVDDDTLAQFYRHATMFVFPSVFEGFGMPPVEALGFGLPTVTTRAAALPEVTRGLAHTVADPYDPAEWARLMALVLRDPAQFGPSDKDVAALKAFYHPRRIAQAYAAVLFG